MVFSSTRDRVPDHTAQVINDRIKEDERRRVYAMSIAPGRIDLRLRELDVEWDIERAIELNASVLAFTGTVLGVIASPYWLILPALVTAFLFQHAVQGWCPPVPILRRLGFRTVYEIERERHALKALRGDYRGVLEAADKAAAALQASHLGSTG